MTEASPGPFSLGALRAAALEGREPPPLRSVARLKSYRWFVVGTVCIGAVMGQVDASMTQVLLPRLEVEFGARLASVSWVAVAYLLALASFMPIFGRLSDMFGRKLLYTAGFLLFIAGSALCGYATSLPWLIFFRVLQAIGGALITSNSVAIVVMIMGPEERGRGLGLQSAAQAVGLGAGPAIGGFILDTLGWQWAFWINVPLGIAGAILGWFVLPQTASPPTHERFDWRGAILIAPALTGFVAALNELHALGPTSPILFACLLVGTVCAILFVRTEHRSASPLLDLKLLTKPAFLLGNLANFTSYATLFGVFFLVPFALVRIYQDTALAAGLRLSILPVMLGLLAPAGGMLYDRLGARLPTCLGMLICIAGLATLYFFLDGTPANLWLVTLSLAVIGVGQGLFISPNSSAIMSAAPAGETGQAGSVLNVMRMLGMSTGIAGASTLLSLSLGSSSGSTLDLPTATLVAASRDAILLLICLAAVAGLISLIRPRGVAGRDAGAVHRDQIVE
ncbi:MFS transporter [Reyranella sp.]|uniref:MFS transporter n=1 Tax=Reyranella sp. TaxID=1929291 RepID=UPI003D107389